MKEKKWCWLICEDDEYEYALAVCENLRELAAYLGISEKSASAYSRGIRVKKGLKVEKVKNEEVAAV